eukprot:4766402-Amphidinium_carterae.1
MATITKALEGAAESKKMSKRGLSPKPGIKDTKSTSSEEEQTSRSTSTNRGGRTNQGKAFVPWYPSCSATTSVFVCCTTTIR